MNWKSMRTAPKDGTTVTLMNADFQVLHGCHYDTTRKQWVEWAQGLGEHGKTWLRVRPDPIKWMPETEEME